LDFLKLFAHHFLIFEYPKTSPGNSSHLVVLYSLKLPPAFLDDVLNLPLTLDTVVTVVFHPPPTIFVPMAVIIVQNRMSSSATV
jgi:hypothetical protein